MKARLLAERLARKKEVAEPSEPLPPVDQMISTETPLDAFDNPPNWLARIRSAFAGFIDRVIMRFGSGRASDEKSGAKPKGQER